MINSIFNGASCQKVCEMNFKINMRIGGRLKVFHPRPLHVVQCVAFLCWPWDKQLSMRMVEVGVRRRSARNRFGFVRRAALVQLVALRLVDLLQTGIAAQMVRQGHQRNLAGRVHWLHLEWAVEDPMGGALVAGQVVACKCLVLPVCWVQTRWEIQEIQVAGSSWLLSVVIWRHIALWSTLKCHR